MPMPWRFPRALLAALAACCWPKSRGSLVPWALIAGSLAQLQGVTSAGAPAAHPGVLRSRFERDGYLVLPAFFGPDAVEAGWRYFQDVVWAANGSRRPRISCQVADAGVFRPGELFDLREANQTVRDLSYRMYFPSANYMRGGRPSPLHWLLLDPRLLAVVGELIGGPIRSLPRQGALVFERGTQQALHEDTWYGLAGASPGGMVGVWIALEDADDDNGPLQYVPGSHIGREENNFTPGLAERWERLRVVGPMQRDAAYEGLRSMALRPTILRARAGDVMVWHERLLHGGAPVIDERRTRLSMVIHYTDRHDPR